MSVHTSTATQSHPATEQLAPDPIHPVPLSPPPLPIPLVPVTPQPHLKAKQNTPQRITQQDVIQKIEEPSVVVPCSVCEENDLSISTLAPLNQGSHLTSSDSSSQRSSPDIYQTSSTDSSTNSVTAATFSKTSDTSEGELSLHGIRVVVINNHCNCNYLMITNVHVQCSLIFFMDQSELLLY